MTHKLWGGGGIRVQSKTALHHAWEIHQTLAKVTVLLCLGGGGREDAFCESVHHIQPLGYLKLSNENDSRKNMYTKGLIELILF